MAAERSASSQAILLFPCQKYVAMPKVTVTDGGESFRKHSNVSGLPGNGETGIFSYTVWLQHLILLFGRVWCTASGPTYGQAGPWARLRAEQPRMRWPFF